MKYHNKYFKKIGYDNSCTENLFFSESLKKDKRSKKWKAERKKYGGYDTRAVWNLNTFMTEQIYTWLRMYLDDADKYIVLTYHTFDINGITMTEKDALKLAISDIEYYLKNLESNDIKVSEESDKRILEAYNIIGIILSSLWY